MAICHDGVKICFGTYSICASPSGICVDGKLGSAGCYVPPIPLQGSSFGYISGEVYEGNQIQKYPFTSDTDASDTAELVACMWGGAGSQDKTHAYQAGGGCSPPQAGQSTIQRFAFSNEATSGTVGNLTVARNYVTGVSSYDCGYAMGGSPACNIIDKFPFASSTSSTDVGDLGAGTQLPGGHESETDGYASSIPFPSSCAIQKFPFASGGNAATVGNLTNNSPRPGGNSSSTHGYNVNPSGQIDKFPFATDTNASCVGSGLHSGPARASSDSTTHGYGAGGYNGTRTISKFPYASENPGVTVGNMVDLTREGIQIPNHV